MRRRRNEITRELSSLSSSLDRSAKVEAEASQLPPSYLRAWHFWVFSWRFGFGGDLGEIFVILPFRLLCTLC